jgi:hypothetical protein
MIARTPFLCTEVLPLPAGVSNGTCIVCGCGPWTACVTVHGFCFWVEKDLCSGCATIRKAERPSRTFPRLVRSKPKTTARGQSND